MTSPYVLTDYNDFGMHTIDVGVKHPDAREWKKCCGMCAFRKQTEHKPTDVRSGSGYVVPLGMSRWKYCGNFSYAQKEAQLGARAFFCTHRVDEDGYFRVCAGYHVTFGIGKRNGR